MGSLMCRFHCRSTMMACMQCEPDWGTRMCSVESMLSGLTHTFASTIV